MFAKFIGMGDYLHRLECGIIMVINQRQSLDCAKGVTMKKLFLPFLLLIALPSLAVVELMPPGQTDCLNNNMKVCKEGAQLYHTPMGCSCMADKDFHSKEICETAKMKPCEKGSHFEKVYQLDAKGKRVEKGCGCFTVHKGPHAE